VTGEPAKSFFTRRPCRTLRAGDREIGGSSPILVQSMTTTKTHDIEATVEQIHRLAALGCELIRVAVPDMRAARALGGIISRVSIPVAADIHFDPELALESLRQGVHKLRLNPGNLRRKDALKDIACLARKRSVPIRIGVNAGSLDRAVIRAFGGVTAEAVVESALSEIKRLEALDFHDIVVSLKSFDVPLMVKAHLVLAREVDYPFHIGVTEAGSEFSGSIRSAVGTGILLSRGIGDTIRVSLTADPAREVEAAYEILKTLGLRRRGPTIVSCPTCGRTGIDLISLLRQVEEGLRECRNDIKVAVMGCVVNGPGEARDADIGIAGGTGEAVLFVKGRITRKVKEEEIVTALLEEIEKLSLDR
jgi:(E)-4-hydroxy-3-methylbut-2-enyl-diphosphate synthase